MTTRSAIRPIRRGPALTLAGLAVAIAVAGCVTGNAAPSKSASSSITTGAAPSTGPTFDQGDSLDPNWTLGAYGSPQPGELQSPTNAPTDSPTATPAPTAAPTPTPPPVSGPTPGVSTTGLNWLALASSQAPTVPASQSSKPPQVNLFGWSRGFIEFTWNPSTRSIVPWSSKDGVAWITGAKLAMTGFATDLVNWDDFQSELKQNGEPAGTCDLRMTSVSEGPSSLVAFGWLVCTPAPCGSAWYMGPAVWASSDGATWQSVTLPSASGIARPEQISGGSSGYVALGSAGSQMSVWTSKDGRTWKQSDTPTPPSGNDQVTTSSAASFAGGLVLGGAIHWGVGGCAYALGPSVTPTTWWSADGSSWASHELPGGVAGQGVTVSLIRIGDRALLAIEDGGSRTWTSTDGKTWTPTANAALLGGLRFFTDGSRCLGLASDGQIYAFDDHLNLTVIAQRGTRPPSGWRAALAPAGLLMTADGLHFYIGVPTGA